MRKPLYRSLFSLGLMGLIASGSHLTVGEFPDDSALRLSWSHIGAKETKSLSPQELADLPIHMRPEDGTVEKHSVPYQLEVEVDEKLLVDEVVKAGGLQADRPLYVFRDFPLSPGPHRVRVSFYPKGTSELDLHYELKQELDFPQGRIVTIGLKRGQKRLVLR